MVTEKEQPVKAPPTQRVQSSEEEEVKSVSPP